MSKVIPLHKKGDVKQFIIYRPIALLPNVIQNYLINRFQYVHYKTATLVKKTVIPQGSILCPLFFSIYIYIYIYINDLVKVNNKHFHLMYAEDTTKYLIFEDVPKDNRHISINLELENSVFVWNSLSLK